MTLRDTFHKFFQEFYLCIFKHVFLLYLRMKICMKIHKTPENFMCTEKFSGEEWKKIFTKKSRIKECKSQNLVGVE